MVRKLFAVLLTLAVVICAIPLTAAADLAPASPAPITGAWVLGNVSGGKHNAVSGKYEGGATGLGQIYTFKPDGTYTALVLWSNAIFFTGKYSIKDGVLTLTDRTVEESTDGGGTWGAKETLPNASAYFVIGTDDMGKYLLMGQEGAAPPLVDKSNALKYRSITPQSSGVEAAVTVSSAFPEKSAPDKDRITGVWVRLQTNTYGTLAGTMARHYYVFYPNGTFMTGIPDNGLYDFNYQERKDSSSSSDTIPDYGTYTFKDGKGQLSGNNGAKLQITMDSRYGSLDIGNYKGFMFIPWLDGKRLEGAFTTIVPNLDGVITASAIAQEPESFLYLRADGTFEDEKGIFRWQGKNYPTMDELFPTGEERDRLVHRAKGTYEIVDFSLILRYDDGITTKHRILPDPIEMSELDYSTNVISPRKIYIRRERARSNLKFFQ